MTTQSIVCSACDGAVPYGRLSCPSCGELLASVGGSRRVIAGAPLKVLATKPAALAALATTVRPMAPDTTVRPAAPDTTVRPDDLRPADASADVATPLVDPSPLHRAMDTLAAATAGWATRSVSAGPAPGAYVPPPSIPAFPAGPPAPAREWAGHAAPPAEVVTTASATDSMTRVAELARWLAVAGSALAAVGFLLPLASSVIGASGVGYLDQWGLAGPGHIVVMLGLLTLLGFALTVDRVPLWLRVGLPGLGLGALLIGLVWPYVLISFLRAGPGAVAILVGAILLGVAGVVALASDRHGGTDRGV